MFSRHFMRAKAFQAIYSHLVCHEDDVAATMNKFQHRLEGLNRLQIYQLSLLPAFVDMVQRANEEAKEKFNPTEEELNPSCRVQENMVLCALSNNADYQKRSDKLHVNWENQSFELRRIYNELRQLPHYRDYENSEADFDIDLDFVLRLFRYMVNNEVLRQTIVDRNLSWEDDFDQIAQYNFTMLKELTETSLIEEALPKMFDSHDEHDEELYTLARTLICGSLQDMDANEELIKRHLTNWDMERVPIMDIVLLNMAITEFTSCPSIPVVVTMNEYVELAKEYSTDKSRIFVNGIMDRIYSYLNSQKRVVKVGRGIPAEDDSSEEER